MTNSYSAKCGHVKRRLNSGEPLSGKVLEFALQIVGQGGTGDALMDGISAKIQAGERLSDYERHIVCDVLLLHARLAGIRSSAQLGPS